MMDNQENLFVDKMKPQPKEIVRKLPLLALLLGSFASGFLLVYFLCGPVTHENKGLITATANWSAQGAGLRELPLENGDTGDPVTTEPTRSEIKPKTVPPGPIPKGVVIEGTPAYLKCWDKSGKSFGAQECDSLEIFEKRLVTRLYVIERCKKRHLREDVEGILSLGAKVDFTQESVSFWSGPSSELEGAVEIAACIRDDLAGLPLDGIRNKFQKYTVYFNMVFRNPGQIEKELRRKKERGRAVEVVKNHVRVRLSPENGMIIGKIGRGNKVALLGRDGDWCRVITPNNNEGWMICDALDR